MMVTEKEDTTTVECETCKGNGAIDGVSCKDCAGFGYYEIDNDAD